VSVSGEYTLKLRCEENHAEEGDQFPTVFCSDFTAPSRFEAKAQAREKGWMLTKDNRAYCPDHVQQGKATWR
jgi:hypothetical protein